MSVRFGFRPPHEGEAGLVVAEMHAPAGSDMLTDQNERLISVSFSAESVGRQLTQLMAVAHLARLELPSPGGTWQAYWHGEPPTKKDLTPLPRLNVIKTKPLNKTLKDRLCSIGAFADKVCDMGDGTISITIPMNSEDVSKLAISMMTVLKFTAAEVSYDEVGERLVLHIQPTAPPKSFLGKVWQGLME